MTFGPKGSVWGKKGETVKIKLRSEGEVRIGKDGERYRAMGMERYFHFARGRSWPEFCIAGDCPRCIQGYKPVKRYLVYLDVEGQAVPRENPHTMLQSLNDAIAECIDEMIPKGMDPTTTWLSITRKSISSWKVESIANEEGT